MSMKNQKNSSSSSGGDGALPVQMSSIKASCYVVDGVSAELKGLHYSTTAGGGKLYSITSHLFLTFSPAPATGVPEVGSGLPSPPSSPPVSSLKQEELRDRYLSLQHDGVNCNNDGQISGRGEGAAYSIALECERLFCETMRAVFLRRGSESGSAAGGSSLDSDAWSEGTDRNDGLRRPSSSGASPVRPLRDQPRLLGRSSASSLVTRWLEVWDYAGGASFRGFTAHGPDPSKACEETLLVFFDEGVVGADLRSGLMALIELATTAEISCPRVVICLDRSLGATQLRSLMRDLGWVGFQLTGLDEWVKEPDILSQEWVFLGMEV
ncbi:MAG: hypothetical protein M4579_000338 [Chaenotheca gracillima]|nr:MAG: hypothetical protein M4579_000338 [Chaenotheca gracillima]